MAVGDGFNGKIHIFSRNLKQQRFEIFFIEFLFVFCYKTCNKERE